ncbi:hypothetical protein DPMN_184115 [Dreissena polymorpha]|uniref:Uncharacterized protein n=1 Tax=Dreissena polymorpha TaxID=45954 RepID=A0A9D4DL58_DREPO|nr:hypothetical protein DPMN_184115 [Dreissena polymorpha]
MSTCLDTSASGTFPCLLCGWELTVPEGGLFKFNVNQNIKVEQTIERALAAPDGPVPYELKMS